MGVTSEPATVTATVAALSDSVGDGLGVVGDLLGDFVGAGVEDWGADELGSVLVESAVSSPPQPVSVSMVVAVMARRARRRRSVVMTPIFPQTVTATSEGTAASTRSVGPATKTNSVFRRCETVPTFSPVGPWIPICAPT
jgi:hypothetical protein